jgi:hypothetical protein
MQSRLYFMSLAGLCILAAMLFDRILSSGQRLRQSALLLGSAVTVLMFAAGSYQQARAFAEISHRNADLARQAMAIAETIEWPESGPCHLVLEEITPPPEWSIYVSMDSVVKALYPDLEKIDHCFIHANYPTFYHLIASEHADIDAAPFEAPIYEGLPLARRRVGGLTIAYLEGQESLSESEFSQLPRRHIDSADRIEE